MNKEYIPRIIDDVIKINLQVFGAINIVGPKWCGKTTTGDQFSKSSIKLQKEPNKESLIETAKITPQVLLNGEQPRLIDEWQDAPTLWEAVRDYCDDNPGHGHFILTGSTSKKIKTSHSGTGRITTIMMYPMSLFESRESNGLISLSDLFNGTVDFKNGIESKMEVSDYIFAACRGGWPDCFTVKNKDYQLLIAKDYFHQIYERDMFYVDDVERHPNLMKALIKSYARNISTLAKDTNIINDILTQENISDKTYYDYLNVLERLFIVQDINGWCPAIRSKENMRSGRKREFVDPSLAVAALGQSPQSLALDLKTFGFIFENMCIRDLKIYSQSLGGEISYYHDRYGLEADVVLHLEDGRFALIEIKLGAHDVDEAAKHLLEIERLIEEFNIKEQQVKLKKPDLKIVLTGTKYAYKRDDGVYVIPLGCLKN